MRPALNGIPFQNIQIILAGIGGQGILFSTRVFSEWGLKMGLGVMGSETHGMSQRGGSVTTHLKLGDFLSPMIRTGQADLLYAFDKNEAYRTLKFLRAGGCGFVNLAAPDELDPEILVHLQEKNIQVRTFDANHLAADTGWIRSANVVLMGFSVGTGLVPFVYADLRQVVETLSRKKQLDINLSAFDLGYDAGKKQLK